MRLLQVFCALLVVLLGFGLLVSGLLALGTLARRALHQSRAGVLRVSHRGALVLASAFLTFQRIVYPHVRHAMVQELKEDDDAGDEAAPFGGEFYQRQLRCIRRGEDVGDLQVVRNAQDAPP